MSLKIYFTIFFSFLLFNGCGQNEKANAAEASHPVQIKRFDKDLYTYVQHPADSLQQQLSASYPAMLSVIGRGVLHIGTPDSAGFFDRLARFYAEPTLNRLYRDAVAQYDSIADIETELGAGFASLRQLFPAMPLPAVYMHVSGFNQNVIADDSLLSISIDKYLGTDYPLYQQFFPPYLLKKMRRQQIVPDYLAGWIMSEYPFSGDSKILLERMIYEGKIKYLLSRILPQRASHTLIGYTEEEENWCKEHESRIWQLILAKKHLTTPDEITTDQYINDTPHTAGFPTNAPGSLGIWIGWRIVDRYMQQTQTQPEELLKNNNFQDILTLSKYKP